jgi:hypothetical protein
MSSLNYRREPTDEIELHWRLADKLTLRATHALYLFRKLRGREILYIGKAERQTIGSRWSCQSKKWLERLAKREGIGTKPLITGFHATRRITPHLIDDVERLLIFLIGPRWNGPGKETCRLYHRHLVVSCSGEWPHPRTTFEYLDDFPSSLSYSSE